MSAVVLAAGEGTRMRSTRPKPLHRLCGRPMVLHVLDALAELSVARVVVVVGHRAEWVTKTLIEHAPPGMAIEFVEQVEQRGTGDAMAVALTGLPDEDGDDDGDVVVLPGDTPLLRPATLAALVHQHRISDNAATLLTAELDDPSGYGRVVRGRDDSVARVVEHVDASDDELAVREINTSIYCFRRSVLAPSLRRLSPANAQGEHYLTDVVGVLYEAGHKVGSVLVSDTMEVAGVNDRAQLAVAEAELRDRINERWMRRGVTMWDPERTYIDVDVEIDPDVVHAPGGHPPGVVCRGRTRRDRPRRPSGRHGGGGGGTGGFECGPALGDRGQCPYRSVRRAGRGNRGAGRRGGRAVDRDSRGDRPGSDGSDGSGSVVGMEFTPRRRLELVSGRSHPELARDVARQLGVELGEANLREFANGEIHCRFDTSIRGSDVFIIQTHCGPVNDSLMEHLIMIDAAKRASAKRITAVCPYYGYSRQDRKATGREPITAKLVADMLSVAGADRVVSVDLHSGQIQGFFNVPFDHLTAAPVLVDYLRTQRSDDLVVVAPDAGRVKVAERFSQHLTADLAVVHKRRLRGTANQVEALHVVGDVEGRQCVLIDDMIDTAGTIVAAADLLVDRGAAEVWCMATHAVLSDPAVDRLKNSALTRVVVTNTLPIPQDRHFDKLEVLSVAKLISDAIDAVFEDSSVSEIFGGENLA